jgi:hypothetical protein
MANKKLQSAIAAQKTNILSYRNALKASRVGGAKYTGSVLDAIGSNLQTTTRGVTAQMTATQAATLAALKRTQTRAQAAGVRALGQARTGVRNQYGSAIAGGTDFSAAAAAVRSNKVAGKGAVGAGRLLAQGDQAAAGIMAQSVQAAQAAAQYSLGQAETFRAKNDAAAVAAQRLDLQKMVLQNQLDLQNYQKKLQMQDQTKKTQSAAVVPVVAQDVSGALDYFKENQDSGKDPATLASEYIAANITDPNEAQLAAPIFTKLYSFINAHDGAINETQVSNIVTQQLAIYYPDYDMTSIGKYLTAAFLNKTLTAAAAPAAGGTSSLPNNQGMGVAAPAYGSSGYQGTNPYAPR